MIFERLEPVDPLEGPLGTLTARLHIADVNQAEVAEFAQHLGSSNPDTPRLVTPPDVDSTTGVGCSNVGRSVVRCIKADFRNCTLILQHVLKIYKIDTVLLRSELKT